MGRISQKDKLKLMTAIDTPNKIKFENNLSDNSKVNDLNQEKLRILPILQQCNEVFNREFSKSHKPAHHITTVNQGLLCKIDLNQLLCSVSLPFKFLDIVPKTFYTQNLINSHEENILLLLPLLRDKSYQLYNQLTSPFELGLENAFYLAKNNIKIYPGQDASLEEFISSAYAFNEHFIKNYIIYTSELPGFARICMEDLTNIVKSMILVVLFLCTSKYFVNDECYLMVCDIQLTKNRICDMVGSESCEFIFSFHRFFQNLNLTSNENALLIPFILSSLGKTKV